MIDTDKYEGVTRFDLVEQHNIHELAILLLDQFAEVKRLRALFEETNHHLDLMVERFGIEALVEMVGEEE